MSLPVEIGSILLSVSSVVFSVFSVVDSEKLRLSKKKKSSTFYERFLDLESQRHDLNVDLEELSPINSLEKQLEEIEQILELEQENSFLIKYSKYEKVFSEYVVGMLYRKEVDGKKDVKNITIVGDLLKEKFKNIIYANLSLGLSLVIYNISKLKYNYSGIESYGNEVMVFLIILLVIYQTLLNYRLKNGLYGTNEYEAREILSFIIKKSNNKNNDMGKKVFPYEEEKIRELILSKGSTGDLEGLYE